ncbi:MAG: hypothetical protein IKE95_00920 [Methanobrevibacter sp.]|nr:hypothetical protein [Methanobrevibacter sp.]
MKYNVEKYVTNTQGQYSATVADTFDDVKKAKKNYHLSLASYYNAADVLVAVVKIVDEYGNPLDGFREVVDNTPEEEPEQPEENQGE